MRLATIAGLAIIVPFAAAACSSSAPAPAPTHAARAIGPTGAALRGALVTAVPKGFTFNKTGSPDSGDEPLTPVSGSMKTKSHCADLNATAFIQASGDAGIGFAQSDYLDPQNNEIAQEVDSFATTAAATKAVTNLKKFFEQCARFSYKQGGTKFSVKLATSAASGLGTGAFKGTMTSAQWIGGSTLVVAQQGAYVITAFYSTRSSTHGSEILAIAAKIRTNLTAP